MVDRTPIIRPEDCVSCGESLGNPRPMPTAHIERAKCPKSQRKCGHHCNHSWSHDRCDWCGEEWGEVDG